MNRLRALLLLILIAAGTLLGGCGNKGPLYLPDSRQAPQELAESDGASTSK